MRETASRAATLGVLALLAITYGVKGENVAEAELAKHPQEDSVEFEKHPLYASLQKENRRLLDLGDPSEVPNHVEERKPSGIDYGDSVTGYNLPDSYSSAPSYADPSLLTAVMTQADEANFRYPVRTTVPPATDQSASASKAHAEHSEPESNEIDPFELFPPQFHELLEIPLHTYSNGSSYSPHNRQESRPMGPFISKGYANTKIQGGNRVRTQSNSNTPQVAYKPKPVFNNKPNQSVTHSRRPATSSQETTPISRTSSSSSSSTTTTTTTATTATTTTTTSTPTTHIPSFVRSTLPPRRKVYVSPPSRTPPRPATSRRPTTFHQETTTSEISHTPSKATTLETRYSPETSPPRPYEFETRIREDSKDRDNQLRLPENIPPLRYTRRPTPQYPSSYLTTAEPTVDHPSTPSLTTAKESSHDYSTERSVSIQKTRVPLYGTRIPSRGPSITTTTADSLSPIPVEELKLRPLKNPNPTPPSHSETILEEKNEELFRPSKIDPFLRPRFPTTTEQISLSEEWHNNPQEILEVLPPVVNTYEVAEQPSLHSELGSKPVPINISAPPLPSQPPSFPPPPNPPSRPLLPPPPIPAGQPPFTSPHQPQAASYQPSKPSSRPPSVAQAPPPRRVRPVLAPQPSSPPRLERPSLAPPPLPPPREFFNNEILPPFPPAPLADPPTSFSRPPAERPTHSPLAFGPPTRHFNIHRPRPGPTQFPVSNKPRRVLRPRPQPHPPSSRPPVHPTFQIAHPVITPPPLPHDVAEQPEPGFTLPVEAGNLPKHPSVNGESPVNRLQNNAPNILPQFRPNAPRQHETFGFQEPSDRVFNTRPRPLRTDKRPILTKRPSFLENFNFFRRTPVNRRRGETGPRTDINNAQHKMTKKQNLVDKTAAIHYQLTHGPLPKHAQKVVVIGPFMQPPPGAPIIPVPKSNIAPPISSLQNKSLPPPPTPPSHKVPPPPALPSRKVTPPPVSFQQSISQESHVAKKGHIGQAEDRIGSELLPTPSRIRQNFSGAIPTHDSDPQKREGIKETPGVIYGQTFSLKPQRVPALSVDQLQSLPPVDEVSEEHKEAIIAGKFRFPPMSVDRSGAGDENSFPQNIIPMPVPIITPQQNSPVKWSVFGFGSPSKSKAPSPPEHMIAQPSRIQRPPLPPHKVSALRAPPPVPPHLQRLHKVRLNKPSSRQPIPSRYNRPPPFDLPPVPPQFVDIHHKNLTKDKSEINVTSSSPITITSTTEQPVKEMSTFIPFSVPSVTFKPTKPRPVYKPTTTTTTTTTITTTTTSTTERPFTTAKTEINTPKTNIKNLATQQPIQNPTTSQPVTPMRITEYNPYNEHYRPYSSGVAESDKEGGFKAPVIKSSDYSGWKAVGAPRLPSTGPGDGLSPVISYVKENIPDILIAPIRRSMDSVTDDDIVTGVISDRMGEVDDDNDSQLVKYSSQFNVETPGIVRSYWIEPPSLI